MWLKLSPVPDARAKKWRGKTPSISLAFILRSPRKISLAPWATIFWTFLVFPGAGFSLKSRKLKTGSESFFLYILNSALNKGFKSFAGNKAIGYNTKWAGLLARTRPLFFRLASGPKRCLGLSKNAAVPDIFFSATFRATIHYLNSWNGIHLCMFNYVNPLFMLFLKIDK